MAKGRVFSIFLTGLVATGVTVLVGCNLGTPIPNSDPKYSENTDVKSAGWENSTLLSRRQWTLHTYAELKQSQPSFASFEPQDIEDFCPGYKTMNEDRRLNFWTQLIAAMVKFESGYNPSAAYREQMFDSQGRQIISRGLLQLTFSTEKEICGLTRESELENGFRNLSCGIKLLHRYLKKDNLITGKSGEKYLGGARYWAVLREGHHNFLEQIQARTVRFCREKL